MSHWKTGAAALCVIAATPSFAADKEPCATDAICASKPQTLVEAMQAAGFRAKLGKDNQGDPKIDSAAGGYDFQIYFYDCENSEKCGSVQFYLGFSAEDDNTAEYANKWNVLKRFATLSANDKKELVLRYDLSTVGGLTKANFTDAVEWWATMLDGFNQFVKDEKKKQ